jgi:hypothetical protein
MEEQFKLYMDLGMDLSAKTKTIMDQINPFPVKENQ